MQLLDLRNIEFKHTDEKCADLTEFRAHGSSALILIFRVDVVFSSYKSRFLPHPTPCHTNVYVVFHCNNLNITGSTVSCILQKAPECEINPIFALILSFFSGNTWFGLTVILPSYKPLNLIKLIVVAFCAAQVFNKLFE